MTYNVFGGTLNPCSIYLSYAMWCDEAGPKFTFVKYEFWLSKFVECECK